jgi:hypothetical protein
MNIQEATRLAIEANGWIKNYDRTDELTLYVAAGNVYRFESGEEFTMDAKDCLSDEWYVI